MTQLMYLQFLGHRMLRESCPVLQESCEEGGNLLLSGTVSRSHFVVVTIVEGENINLKALSNISP